MKHPSRFFSSQAVIKLALIFVFVFSIVFSNTTANAAGSAGHFPVNRNNRMTQGMKVSIQTTSSKTLITNRAIATWPGNVPAAEKRPVLVFLPGWGGVGAVNASVNAHNLLLVNEGYVTLAIGFDSSATWISDMDIKTKAGLDLLCADASIPANCSAITLVGESYGSAQNYWVIEYLRSNGYNGSSAGNAIAFLSEDSGYGAPGITTDYNTGAFTRSGLADTSAYSVAMIENLGDTTFPVDDCTWGNCGARTLGDAHLARGDQNVFSICPAGGEHGTREFANWDIWAISALKTMIHTTSGIPTFTGYTAPTLTVTNACTTTQNEYTLTVTSAQGSVTQSPNQITYHEGDVVQLSATPDAGWSFANWTEGLTSSSNPGSVTIHGNTVVTANYSPTIVNTITLTSIAAQDGWILESAETSKKGGVFNSKASTIQLGDDSGKRQFLSILSFATGADLPDTAVITGVTLKVKKQGIVGGGNPVTAFQGFMADIKNGSFGTAALQASDFQSGASKTYGPFKPALIGGWYSIDLTSGNAYINKLNTTQIRLRFRLDDNNNAIANILSLYSGSAPVTSRPQLLITYTMP